jgi:hypothetical protein
MIPLSGSHSFRDLELRDEEREIALELFKRFAVDPERFDMGQLLLESACAKPWQLFGISGTAIIIILRLHVRGFAAWSRCKASLVAFQNRLDYVACSQ